VPTSPFYSLNSSKIDVSDFCKKNKSTKKTIVHHRRHLPLTKKIEIERSHPIITADYSIAPIIEEYYTHHKIFNNYLKFPLKDILKNKAPPTYYC
jgi:hypothetical protein